MRFLSMLVMGAAALVFLTHARAQAAAMPRPGVAASAPPNLTMDPAVWSLVSATPHVAILTFDHHPSAAEVVAIEAAVLAVHRYRTLPMVAVRGTGAQLRGLVGLPGLRSIFLNEDVEDEHSALTAVTDRDHGSTAIRIDSASPASVATMLEGLDWVFRNRAKYGIEAVASGWASSGGGSPESPIGVAMKLAHDAGLAMVGEIAP